MKDSFHDVRVSPHDTPCSASTTGDPKVLPIIYRLKRSTAEKTVGLVTRDDEVTGEYEVAHLKLRTLTSMYSPILITTYKHNKKSPAIEEIFRKEQYRLPKKANRNCNRNFKSYNTNKVYENTCLLCI